MNVKIRRHIGLEVEPRCDDLVINRRLRRRRM